MARQLSLSMAGVLLLMGLVSISAYHPNRVADGEYFSVSIPGDHHYPKGLCKARECDLRGAWNMAMGLKKQTPLIYIRISSTELVYPLVGKKGARVNLEGLFRIGTTVSLNTTMGEHHSEAIRWLDFDSTAYLYITSINFQGFRLSEPSGPPVQEFGGAINLGRTPVQDGYPGKNACKKFTAPALPRPNLHLDSVNFTKNEFKPSSPPIHYGYGVAAAVSCAGCNVYFHEVNFINNKAGIGSSAIGIVWMNVAKYTGKGVVFTGNSITGSEFHQCPMTAGVALTA